MSAIIKQQYTDPHNKAFMTRDMILEVEVVRPDNTLNMNSIVCLTIDPTQLHIPNPPTFERVIVSPDEALTMLIDGKRTYCPKDCLRSRLSTPNRGMEITTEDIAKLSPNIGDPIVILDRLKEPQVVFYSIVDAISSNSIKLMPTKSDIPRFYQGAIVQNLANRWHPSTDVVGAKSQLKRPSTPIFAANRRDVSVDIAISLPLNKGVLKYYDIYVRNEPFDSLELHWVPDIADLDANAAKVAIETYSGGTDAGFGFIKDIPESTLYVAVIGKDASGNANVNESQCNVKILPRIH